MPLDRLWDSSDCKGHIAAGRPVPAAVALHITAKTFDRRNCGNPSVNQHLLVDNQHSEIVLLNCLGRLFIDDRVMLYLYDSEYVLSGFHCLQTSAHSTDKFSPFRLCESKKGKQKQNSLQKKVN